MRMTVSTTDLAIAWRKAKGEKKQVLLRVIQ